MIKILIKILTKILITIIVLYGFIMLVIIENDNNGLFAKLWFPTFLLTLIVIW
jgi:hypothetical protein